jgi:hypothetical protein
MDQREGRQLARVPAGPGRHRDQAVGALLDGLAGEAVVDHVVQHHAAVGMHRRVQILPRAQRGDHDRRLPAGRGLQVVLQPVVGLVDDVVDREGRGRRVGMVAVPLGQFLGDPVQPFVEQGGRPRVQRRERAHDAGLALGDHQVRHGDDEQWRADHRQTQAVTEHGRQGHGRRPRKL